MTGKVGAVGDHSAFYCTHSIHRGRIHRAHLRELRGGKCHRRAFYPLSIVDIARGRRVSPFGRQAGWRLFRSAAAPSNLAAPPPLRCLPLSPLTPGWKSPTNKCPTPVFSSRFPSTKPLETMCCLGTLAEAAVDIWVRWSQAALGLGGHIHIGR